MFEKAHDIFVNESANSNEERLMWSEAWPFKDEEASGDGESGEAS